MRIIYFLKNLKINQLVKDFIFKKIKKIKKREPSLEQGLVEVGLERSEEIKSKEGFYKAKIIFTLPKKGLIIVKSSGKNLFQAINSGFKKIFRQLTKHK